MLTLQFINAEHTLLITYWPGEGVGEVAFRDTPDSTWGPPWKIEPNDIATRSMMAAIGGVSNGE